MFILRQQLQRPEVEVKIKSENREVTENFKLGNVYPNPFNATATIDYAIPRQTLIRLNVYDLQGKVILPLVNQEKLPGAYSVQVDVRKIASGMYFYRLEAEGRQIAKKMVVTK